MTVLAIENIFYTTVGNTFYTSGEARDSACNREHILRQLEGTHSTHQGKRVTVLAIENTF